MELFKCLVTDLVSSWDGMIALTGDLNVDLLRPNAPDAKIFRVVGRRKFEADWYQGNAYYQKVRKAS